MNRIGVFVFSIVLGFIFIILGIDSVVSILNNKPSDDNQDKQIIPEIITRAKENKRKGCWTNLDGSKPISVSCTTNGNFVVICTVCGTYVGKNKVMCRSFNQDSCF